MKGLEIKEELKGMQDAERCFIKWWRPENDFVDYELVDDFLQKAEPEQEFAGYELLTKEEMWVLLRHYAGDNTALDRRHGEKVIVWRQADSGATEVLPFTPEALMQVFDAETGGDTLD